MLRSPWMMPGVSESTFGASFYKSLLDKLGCKEIHAKYCGVYPPWRTRAFLKHTKIFDGSVAAWLMGWYFMVRAKKE